MKNVIYMILAALCLATVGALVKLVDNNVPVMTLNFLRIFIGFLILLLIVPFIDKNWYKISKKDFKDFSIIGALFAIALSLYTAANVFAPIQNAVLINYSYPFFVLLFAFFILNEKITKTKLTTLIIAFTGLIIINPFQVGDYLFGNLLALFGALAYGILIVNMRRIDMDHSIGDVVWFLFFASLILFPFSIIYGFGDINEVWIYVTLLGIISTGLAYLFYNLALEDLEAEMGAIIATIITPLVSLILAVVIIGEHLDLKVIIGGGLLILSGLYLETHKKKIKKDN